MSKGACEAGMHTVAITLLFYRQCGEGSKEGVIMKESELHHSIGSPIDGAHPGPKTDRNYLGRYCP